MNIEMNKKLWFMQSFLRTNIICCVRIFKRSEDSPITDGLSSTKTVQTVALFYASAGVWKQQNYIPR